MSYQEGALAAARERLLTLLKERNVWTESALRKASGLSVSVFKEVLMKLLAEEQIEQHYAGAAGSEVQLMPVALSPAELLEGPVTVQAHQVLLRLQAGPEGVRGLSKKLELEVGAVQSMLAELERMGHIERRRVGMLTIYRLRSS